MLGVGFGTTMQLLDAVTCGQIDILSPCSRAPNSRMKVKFIEFGARCRYYL